MNTSKTDTRLGLTITLAVAAFLIGPVVLSVLAGLTKRIVADLPCVTLTSIEAIEEARQQFNQ